MRKNVSLFMLLLLINSTISAQFANFDVDEIQKIKKSILLVLLEEENPKTLKKLAKKPERLEHYKNQIEGRNISLKTAAESFWNFSDSVIAIPKSVLETQITNLDNYVVLTYSEIVEYERIKTGFGTDGKPAGWQRTLNYARTKPNQPAYSELTYNPSTKYTELSNITTSLKLYGYGSSIDIYLPNAYPSYSDAIYGIKQLQYILSFHEANPNASSSAFLKQVEKNNTRLQDKTLLLDKNELHKKLTQDVIKKVYPYNFKIVDNEFINKVIIEGSDEYAYIQIVYLPNSQGSINVQVISDPSNGMIFCYEYPKVSVAKIGNISFEYNERIKEKNLKKYIKNNR